MNGEAGQGQGDWNGTKCAALLDRIVRTLERFVRLPPHAAEAIALWVVHTHAFEAAEVSPILAIVSPVKRCGKTRLVSLLNGLVRAPLPTSNASSAAIFRAIDESHPTLLMDEADTYMPARDELRGIINSGHTKSAAFVLRCVGDASNYKVRRFSTWAPKVIARIGWPSGTIADRSIVIRMQRKDRGDTTEPLREARFTREIEPLHKAIEDWAESHMEQLKKADPRLPRELNDRAADNWNPLLAIADLASGDWPARARKAALGLSGGSHAEGEVDGDVQILADLRELFCQQGWPPKLASEDLIRELVQMEDRPWPEHSFGRPITQRQLAVLLKPFGVRPKTFRAGDKTPRGYDRSELEHVWARYLPPDPEADLKQSATLLKTKDLGEKADTQRVLVSEPSATPQDIEGARLSWPVADVADVEGSSA